MLTNKSMAILVAATFGTAFSLFGSAADNLSAKDKTFVNKAVEAGYAEVEAGKLAVSNSSNKQIRMFGEQMVQDHGKASAELAKIAEKKGLTVPTEPDSAHKDLTTKLTASKGDTFDKIYIAEAGVKDHKAAVDLFADEAKSGQDADIKAFAVKTLPAIQHHYEMAKNLSDLKNKP